MVSEVSRLQSAPGYRSNDQKRLFARRNLVRQGRVRRFVRKVILTGKKAQECTALLGGMIANRSAQHRVAQLKRINNRTLSHRRLNRKHNLSLRGRSHSSQGAQMRRTLKP